MSASARPRSTQLVARSLALAIGLASGLGAAEVALRTSGVYATYSESNFGAYSEVWGRTNASWVHTWEPNVELDFTTAEFTCAYATNGDGLRDVEHPLVGDPGRWRIAVLGDSYVEGAGVSASEAWPAELGRLLERDGYPVEIFNGGVSGSDPFFEYQLLRQRLLRYAPDLVIVAINQTDQVDTLWWGGMERFGEDGRTYGRPAPPGFQAFRHSHLARWFLFTFGGLDREFLAYGSHPRLLWDMQQELLPAFDAIDALRAEHPFELLVLIHPIPCNIPWLDSGYFVDFLEALAARGIEAVDLSAPLHAELGGLPLEEYAWRIDGHFNAHGYRAFARVVESLLKVRRARQDALAQPR
jgi:lysophospholipase L1-like esterase